MKKINILYSSKAHFLNIYSNLLSQLKNSEKINFISIDEETNRLPSLIKDIDFDIFLHKNEHCQLNTCQYIKKIIDYCYENNKIAMYIDFGYFNHNQNYIIDFYLPNYQSSIQKSFYNLNNQVDNLQENNQIYISNFIKKISSLKDSDDWKRLNLPENKFVVIWPQYSIKLLKEVFKKKCNNITDWINLACEKIKEHNLIPVIKISPCKINYDIKNIKEALILSSNKNQSKTFNLPYIENVNFYLNKYAHSHIINCSSISNELLINNSKIIAMGRSWFNNFNIFYEPDSWDNLMDYQAPNQININKWINWWNLKQFPKENIEEKIIETYHNYFNIQYLQNNK